MDNNYLIQNPTPLSTDKEQELAILFLDIRNFMGLMESQPDQSHTQVARLVGKPYNVEQDFDYLLAISG